MELFLELTEGRSAFMAMKAEVAVLSGHMTFKNIYGMQREGLRLHQWRWVHVC